MRKGYKRWLYQTTSSNPAPNSQPTSIVRYANSARYSGSEIGVDEKVQDCISYAPAAHLKSDAHSSTENQRGFFQPTGPPLVERARANPAIEQRLRSRHPNVLILRSRNDLLLADPACIAAVRLLGARRYQGLVGLSSSPPSKLRTVAVAIPAISIPM